MIDVLLALQRPAEVVKLCAELLEVRRSVDPPRFGNIAQTLEQLGHAYYQQGRFEDARSAWQECLELRTNIPAENWLTYRASNHLGSALVRLGKFDAAEVLLLESYSKLSELSGEIPLNSGDGCLETARARLSDLYDTWGKPERAAAFRQ